jgi:hypothetical protein
MLCGVVVVVVALPESGDYTQKQMGRIQVSTLFT